ncbi:hypothetical protein NOV18_08640 [Pseudomonas asiatica]|uniref:Uncharacterized protein n=1 Tax=Pseudomonas asiatica TaxID=2219225 RepID=A0AAJ5I118_9PSED|nr:hypothetical protein [Pseudomonas asiatica]UUC21712.1 hypothetical protein NOV18_08640 [Pseudomonas asiatica]
MSFNSPEYKAWLYSGTIEMPLRDFLSTALSKREPDIIFEQCIHDFSSSELAEIINVDELGYSPNLDEMLVHKKHLWSPTRVYFIYDDDGRYCIQSAPRNPG